MKSSQKNRSQPKHYLESFLLLLLLLLLIIYHLPTASHPCKSRVQNKQVHMLQNFNRCVRAGLDWSSGGVGIVVGVVGG